VRRAAVVALLLLATLGAGSCHATRGLRVTLFGGVDDPDVLVWDSRERLVDYSSGSVDTRQFMLPHAMLNRPGTRAVVIGCVAQIVHPKFSMTSADAVGILILSGKYRGRYGWVSSSDIHARGLPEAPDRW
jgi:hypothetical protein